MDSKHPIGEAAMRKVQAVLAQCGSAPRGIGAERH